MIAFKFTELEPGETLQAHLQRLENESIVAGPFLPVSVPDTALTGALAVAAPACLVQAALGGALPAGWQGCAHWAHGHICKQAAITV